MKCGDSQKNVTYNVAICASAQSTQSLHCFCDVLQSVDYGGYFSWPDSRLI